MMTRKDYISTAKILNDAINGAFENESEVVEAFADMFEQDNPTFDRSRFIYAVNQ
jgi:hypothetical protein